MEKSAGIGHRKVIARAVDLEARGTRCGAHLVQDFQDFGRVQDHVHARRYAIWLAAFARRGQILLIDRKRRRDLGEAGKYHPRPAKGVGKDPVH